MPQNARKAALGALVKMQRDKGYSNLTLSGVLASSGLDGRESALASALFYGVVERMYTLDYIIRMYAGRRADKLPYTVQGALRLGTYQILYMDKIPHHAAVSESVSLVKKEAPWAAGLVNAVLKKISADKEKCLAAVENSGDPVIKYSCERWIYDLLVRDYGEAADKILASATARRPLTLRVNTLINTAEELVSRLCEEGAKPETPQGFHGALLLKDAGNIENLASFKEGRFHVQDIASQLCCAALDPKPGMRVLDICSAPGGKAFTAAEMMEDSGEIIAQDLYDARTGLIDSGAKRLGISCIKTKTGDASVFDESLGLFDRVLCDVPCSGLGVISKKPDIKYKSIEEVKQLPDIQLSILMTAAKYLKPGGVLIYSTCTLNKDENEGVVNKFLNAGSLISIDIPNIYDIIKGNGGHANMQTLMPHIHLTDGFFIAAFKRL